ncbi:hypothetical protein ACQJBY_060044 [Aegilops geniculata]
MAPAPAPASSGRIRPWLVVGDLVLAVLWVCAGALVKLAVYNVLGLGGRPEGEAAKVSLSVVYMFLFAWLESATGGASYNPLTAISGALASRGGIALYLFTVFVRVPAQVIGAVIGVMLMRFAFPKVGKGAALSVGVHHGALTEGLATLMVVMVSLTLKKKEQGFFVKTWIASIWKMTIHILSSDMTGGIMNPASVSVIYT